VGGIAYLTIGISLQINKTIFDQEAAMLFIQPAVVPADDLARDSVAEVRTVARPVRDAGLRWNPALELAQAAGVQSAPSTVAPSAAVPGVGGTPPITNPAGSPVPPNPVGAAPPIPGTNAAGSAGGNTYGTQQEGAATGTTAPVTPGVPGPGTGAAGSGGGGLAAPEVARPSGGGIDSNASSPYNSSGNGAGLTGTGMRTTAAPPTGGTTATPPSSGTALPPVQSGSSGTR
jgi:hypothetical protein